MARTRKPTNLKIITGNPGKRSINKCIPQPDLLNDLSPPSYLSPASAAVWNEIAPVFREFRMLTVVDVIHFAIWCDAIAEYRMCRNRCADSPMVFSEKTGGEVISQWRILQSMNSKVVDSMGGNFGANPRLRESLKDDPIGSLFPDEDGQDYFT